MDKMRRQADVSLHLLMIFFFICHSLGSDPSWSMKKIKEMDRNCRQCACMGQAVDKKYRNEVLAIFSKEVYNTMSIKSGYAWTHFVLRGKPPTSNEDIDSLCNSGICLPESGLCVKQSSDVNVTMNINFKNFPDYSVFNIKQHFDPHQMSAAHGKTYVSMTAPFRISVVWTDRVKNYLSTFCDWDGRTGWYLNSAEKVLSPKVKRIVLKKIEALGFNPANAYAPNFHNCPTK